MPIALSSSRQACSRFSAVTATLTSQRGVHWRDRRTINDQLAEHEVRQGDNHSFRVRKNGRELPLPPFLDPAVHTDHMEYTKLDDQEWNVDLPESGFRQELARNPYAAALVTPLRGCDITSVRLPRHFLQRFNVVRTPKAERKLSIEPRSEHTPLSSDAVTGASSYCVNHRKGLALANKRYNWARLIKVWQVEKCARELNRSHNSFESKKVLGWDPQMAQRIETDLSKVASSEFKALRELDESLLVGEEELKSRLNQIVVFVRTASSAAPTDALHDRPLITISSPAGDTAKDSSPYGVVGDRRTIPLLLALDRIRQFGSTG